MGTRPQYFPPLLFHLVMKSVSQSVRRPASQSISQAVCCLGGVEDCRRALCLNRGAPDTTVASPGPYTMAFGTKAHTLGQWGPSSEVGVGGRFDGTAGLRLSTCTLQNRTVPTFPARPPTQRERERETTSTPHNTGVKEYE